MKIKLKTYTILVISIILIILSGIFMYKVYGITGKTLAEWAYGNSDSFWNYSDMGVTASPGDGLYESDSSRLWVCLNHKRNAENWDDAHFDGYGRVRAILDINPNGVSTFTTRKYVNGGLTTVSGSTVNNYTAKMLAYLCYAATQWNSRGELGDYGASTEYNDGKGTFYQYFNNAQGKNGVAAPNESELFTLVGDYANIRKLMDPGYGNSAIMEYAKIYANSESASSSATITSKSDSGAQVKVSASSSGGTYSYIGPFTMKTAGNISGVSIQDGNNRPGVAGYANYVGGPIGGVSGIPRNGNQFYIVTSSVLTNTNVSVTINTSGSAGGGTITTINSSGRKTGTTTGYIRARMVFMGGGKSAGAQATAVFRGNIMPTQPSYDSVTFTAKNNLGKITVQKEGTYTGIENYENVANFSFKLYYMQGSTKRYLRINNAGTISGQTSVSMGGNSSYTADVNNATIINTSGNGTVTIDNISNEYKYYIEEVSNSTNYKTEIISATVQAGSGAVTQIAVNGNVAGPITVSLKGASNIVTKIKLEDYRKTGILQIQKVDSDDNTIGLGNVVFTVQNKDTGLYVIADRTSEGVYTVTDPFEGYVETENNATLFETNSATGKAIINELDVGNYIVKEISNPNYGYTVMADDVSVTVVSDTTITATVENEKQTGNMRIVKTDGQDHEYPLENVSFKVRVNTEMQEIDGMIEGKGDINGNGYIDTDDVNLLTYGLSGRIELTETQKEMADVNGDGTVNVVDEMMILHKVTNGGYVIALEIDDSGNVTPVESVKGDIHLDAMTTTNNIDEATEFITNGEGIVNIYNLLIGEYEVAEISVGDNFGYDVDDIYVTWISNMVTQAQQGTKGVIRVERQTSTDSGENSSGEEDLFNRTFFRNTRKYIKIRGFAWEDIEDGKGSTRDNIWTDNSTDKRLEHVTVRLKTADGQIIDETTTDANGEYIFGNYDEDANAIKLEIDKLVGAYIEFEYNGMSYQSVEVNPEFNPYTETKSNGNIVTKYNGNGNTATDEALRNEFDNEFATIDRGNNYERYNGQAYYSNGSLSYGIGYANDSENHRSTVRYGRSVQYGYEGQKYPISGVYEQYTLQAVTKHSSSNVICSSLTPTDIRTNKVEEIGGLNLGVYEREMPDLAIAQDVQDVEIQLNGYTHLYEYSRRFDDPEEYAGGDPFDTTVRFESKYIEGSYSREVYSSDLAYNDKNPGSLDIYVTYRIQLRNETTNLPINLKRLTNYYDERYEDIVVRNDEGTDERGLEGKEIQYDTNSYNSDGLKRIYIQTNYVIQAGQTRYITITYKLNDNAVVALLKGQTTLNSFSEVSAYSTYYPGTTNPYAGIDIDSAPDTMDPNDFENTTEDDSDKAPSLTLVPNEEREIRGTVWEDGAREDLLALEGYEKERKGDGIYQENENVVENVKVELLTENYELAQLYRKKDDNTSENVDAVVTTNEKGEYALDGVIPGKYLIRFTYGNSSVIYDSEGNQIKNVNANEYKSTIYRGGDPDNVDENDYYWYGEETSKEGATRLSDARDHDDFVNKRIESQVDGTGKTDITYGTIAESQMKFTQIYADTNNFEIKLDYDETELNNISEYGIQLKFDFNQIDFGIIERPKQNLELEKTVSNLQVMLANGQDLVNGPPKDIQEQGLAGLRVLPDGGVYLEVDNEILQGATLRITYAIIVDNKNCEIDFNDENYYIYGIVPSGNSNWVIATVTDMYDYLPEDLVFQGELETNDGWEIISPLNNSQGILADPVYDTVKDSSNIIHLTAKGAETFDMEPGQTATETIVVSKQLSPTTDSMEWENDVEIVKLRGRIPNNATPGNYDPEENGSYVPESDLETDTPVNPDPDPTPTPEPLVLGPEEPDDSYVPVVITPPTGEQTQYWTNLYIIAGAIVLIIVGIGVVIIKKKILK